MAKPLDPEEITAGGAPAVAEIPPATRMGPVHLSVGDLERSVDYYRHALGLRLSAEDGLRATLGVEGTDLLVLMEEPGVLSSAGYCGLYHFALLVPERADLARWLSHAAQNGVRLTGMADHYVSEALYLSDPDDHGIEIYWDRPRELWEGLVASRMTTARLDVKDLMNQIGSGQPEPFPGLPAGTSMGHVHLRVSTIPCTTAFYRDTLGFGLMATFGNEAAFLSAGGYHHHLGANTWESAGNPPAPPGTARLLQMNVVLPTAADVERLADRVAGTGQEATHLEGGVLVHDPSGIAVVLRTEDQASSSRP
ncbi:MAG TPA: VOC family protein [Actinomycetota bacterium]|nr:VOC family protein [Actinomycetota bacterium]